MESASERSIGALVEDGAPMLPLYGLLFALGWLVERFVCCGAGCVGGACAMSTPVRRIKTMISDDLNCNIDAG